jgi:phosphoglucosamine mutase
MPEYFGTDGIRGVPFEFPFTPSFLKIIGYSIAKKFQKEREKICVIGVDTRESGKRIFKYLCEGIGSVGFSVIDLGVVTTPSLSYIVSKNKFSFGIMISASHNPPEFNGIKVINKYGEKISIEEEEEIEKIIKKTSKIEKKDLNISKKNYLLDYENYLLEIFKSHFIKRDFFVVIDFANGSTYKIGKNIFKKLGFSFFAIGDKPNGSNINIGCGALDTALMQKNVVEKNAFCGISYDGDGDRCIISDENGEIIDGDDIIAFLSFYYKKNGVLKNNGVSLTKMSNYGLFRFLEEYKIKYDVVDVGDRNVSYSMKKNGFIIGGEPSGHIILQNYLQTGDGILTSLEFLKNVIESGMKVSDVKKIWKRFPSYLRSYKVEAKPDISKLSNFNKKVKDIEKKINGRIFIRYSGTEPLLRILIEADRKKDYLEKLADDIFSYYKASLEKEVL